jgi:DNA-binding GntR family transcriptional regulator
MAKPPVKAQQLAAELTARIRSGDLAPGAWLPPERQLSDDYGVVRSTVRQAVQILADAGLVEQKPGAGAQVLADDVGDAGETTTVRDELVAIREELSVMNERLSVIEARGRSGDYPAM